MREVEGNKIIRYLTQKTSTDAVVVFMIVTNFLLPAYLQNFNLLHSRKFTRGPLTVILTRITLSNI